MTADLSLPWVDVELHCNACGRLFVSHKKTVGRHRRFCTLECRRLAKLRWDRAWRERNRDYRRPCDRVPPGGVEL